jgi:hypothetical protein
MKMNPHEKQQALLHFETPVRSGVHGQQATDSSQQQSQGLGLDERLPQQGQQQQQQQQGHSTQHEQRQLVEQALNAHESSGQQYMRGKNLPQPTAQMPSNGSPVHITGSQQPQGVHVGTSTAAQQQRAATAPVPGLATNHFQSSAAAAAAGTSASVVSPLAGKAAAQAAEQDASTTHPKDAAVTRQVHLQFTGGTGPTQLPANGKPRLFTSISPASQQAAARAAPEASLPDLPDDFDPQAYMDYNPDVVVGMRKVSWVGILGQMSSILQCEFSSNWQRQLATFLLLSKIT